MNTMFNPTHPNSSPFNSSLSFPTVHIHLSLALNSLFKIFISSLKFLTIYFDHKPFFPVLPPLPQPCVLIFDFIVAVYFLNP